MGRLHRHVLILLAVSHIVIWFHGSGASAKRRETDPSFLVVACNKTLYPGLCISSLKGYAAAIKHKSVRRLAHGALKETLSRTESASAAVASAASRGTNAGPDDAESGGGGAGSTDCAESLDNSMRLLRRSLRQLERMGRAGKKRYGFSLSSVQSWISGALTDQNFCLEGFAPGMGTNINSSVKGKISEVSRMTSIALALVNMIDQGH